MKKAYIKQDIILIINNMFCSNCGQKQADGAKFCHNCGSKRATEKNIFNEAVQSFDDSVVKKEAIDKNDSIFSKKKKIGFIDFISLGFLFIGIRVALFFLVLLFGTYINKIDFVGFDVQFWGSNIVAALLTYYIYKININKTSRIWVCAILFYIVSIILVSFVAAAAYSNIDKNKEKNKNLKNLSSNLISKYGIRAGYLYGKVQKTAYNIDQVDNLENLPISNTIDAVYDISAHILTVKCMDGFKISSCLSAFSENENVIINKYFDRCEMLVKDETKSNAMEVLCIAEN